MTIKYRLIALGILVTIGMLFQAMLVQYGTRVTAGLNEIRLNIEQANSGMLLLRRREKDFLARFDLKYEQAFIEDHATLIAKVQELADNMAAYDMDTSDAQHLADILSGYKKAFLALVALQKRIGLNEKDGLYGSLRTAVHNVEDKLKELSDYRLTSMMLTLRRNEKDFMLRSNSKYIDKLGGNLAKMHSVIDEIELPPETKEQLQQQLVIYERDFRALANGYIEKGLTSKEGLRGKMRDIVHQTETLLDKLIASTNQVTSEKTAAIKTFVTVVSILLIIITLIVVATLARSIIRPVSAMQAIMARVRKEDDLSLRVSVSGKDEIAAMGADLNKLLEAFQGVIRVVLASTAQVSTAAEELSAITDETNSRMQQQANDAEMVAAATEELSASVQEVTHSTAETAESTQQAESAVTRGSQVVDETVTTINHLAAEVGQAGEVIARLEEESNNIGTVLDVIRGIAEQTNLLALNAAIEAARAGEQGRGFAVVADEVRSLASRTQDSTREIQSMIERLQAGAQAAVGAMEKGRESAESGVARASEAKTALGEITAAIASINEMASHIAEASRQQGAVVGEVAANVGTIKQSVDDTGHSVSQINVASGELARLATELQHLVERFKA